MISDDKNNFRLKEMVLSLLAQILESINSIVGPETPKSENPQNPKSQNVPEPPRVDDSKNLQLEELKRKAEDFHYLLDSTSFLCSENERKFTLETSETLLQKWEYMLNATYCKSLLKKFTETQKSGRAEAEIIRDWLNFLGSLGLKRFTASEGKVNLSPENRGFFENSRLFDDGASLLVDKYPWFLNGKLLMRGEFYNK